jgi:flavin reductase (DIM6/NTAB) family NADH-FMN oxidoreductase RutF
MTMMIEPRAAHAASVSPPALREQLRGCARRLATGVAVVTTSDLAGRPHGLTMSAVTCVSFDPALFLICVSETSETLPALLQRRAFAIHLLRRDQEALARTFAAKGGTEKFNRIDCTQGVLPGVPVLADALAVIECEMVMAYRGGDHRVVIGSVTAARSYAGEPLLFYAGDYRRLDSGDAALDGRPAGCVAPPRLHTV